ncbi:DNA/RNA non-specific endonuclease [Idiomarina sp. ST10R2A5]|uniref:DNA/RNA non-specific endonuclease n=1 Tax=Idiomarina sp. ST10R2A5 TaxID=3418368 RepID=UPI003EC9193D
MGTDRGHQVPLASFSNTLHWSTTNCLSNITPQAEGLNQGPWALLESAVRVLARTGRTFMSLPTLSMNGISHHYREQSNSTQYHPVTLKLSLLIIMNGWNRQHLYSVRIWLAESPLINPMS